MGLSEEEWDDYEDSEARSAGRVICPECHRPRKHLVPVPHGQICRMCVRAYLPD